MSGKRRIYVGALILGLWGVFACAEALAAEGPEQLQAIAGWKGVNPTSPDAFRFVVVSDRTGNLKPGAWAEAITKVNLLAPDFVMCVGDLIRGYTDDLEEVTRQWDEFDALTKKFNAPFFYCAGNHDITNEALLELYRKRHGVDSRTYYSFDYRGSHFVVLDSHSAMTSQESADEQLAWLKKDMNAAKDSKCVFVFYHHPLWDTPGIWTRLQAILPAEKTTIFNGHSHAVGFKRPDGIATYRLAATAARSSRRSRIEGNILMFAHVTVSGDQSSVAILPVSDVLDADYAEAALRVQKLSPMNIHHRAIAAEGDQFVLKQKNPLTVPMEMTVTWKGMGWETSPSEAEFTAAPGATLEETFSLTPTSATPGRPKITVVYSFTDTQTGESAEIARTVDIGTYAKMEIPHVKNITVDGELDDFASVAPLKMGYRSRIYTSLEFWDGAKDSSFELRAATDGERLYVAVDVTDDNIYTKDVRQVWLNDAVEFFWDARSPAKRDGKHGDRTGHLVLPVPADGSAVKPRWSMKGNTSPKDPHVVCKRREGGYVMEFSLPLSGLGAKTPLAAGQEFRFELRLDDGDKTGDKPTSTRMTTSGIGHNYWYTNGYIRCTFAGPTEK